MLQHTPAPDHHICFDVAVIARYDRNGPRYTSYPTAVEFGPQLDTQAYAAIAADSNRGCAPLSIYVHVPFCASPCFYCGCNKVITRDYSRSEVYLSYLYREIEMQAELFDRHRVVQQLHLGGGTPTFLSSAQLAALLETLQQHFTLSNDPAQREFSIEIDPRTLGPQTLTDLQQLGFNRLSLGVQDFDPQVQAAVNRRQSAEQTLNAIAEARQLGFKSVSVDLIYGLPLQTVPSFARTLHKVLAARPDRIAAYGYAHLPQMFKPQRHIVAAQLPNAAERIELLRLTVDTLTDAGYVYIGMDHFALADDELVRAQDEGTLQRNFQGYSTRAECDLIGLGVSSIGKMGNSYAQNAKTLNEYYAAIENGRLPIQRGLKMNADDVIRRAVIQQVMCHAVLDFDVLSAQLGIDFTHYFADALEALVPLQQDGLLELATNCMRVTPRGRLLLRHIAMAFDAYLQTASEQKFSKAI